jgi:carboxynorspermidine decarboxylase
VSDALTDAFAKVDLSQVPSPCHVLHRGLLEQNLRILRSVMDRSGAKVLLALKGFAQFSEAKLVAKYLAGTTSSGLHEALLGREEFGGEVHAYSPAFKDEEFSHLLRIADHISFNSPSQWKRHRAAALAAGRKISFGLRVNPEHAEVDVELYNPCAAGSRLGTLRSEIKAPADLDGLEGLHFHTMCQQGSDVLERTVAAFEAKFGEFLPRMKWVNFGGGHHITRPGYDLDRLVRVITGFRARWGEHLQVYLEPGEAIGIGTGVLVGTVLDLVHNGVDIAILDLSLPGGYRRGGPARQAAPHLPPWQRHLPCRRRHRGLLFRDPPPGRAAAGLPRHVALYVRQEHDLQRCPAAGHRQLRPGDRTDGSDPPLRLRGLQEPPFLKPVGA